MEIYENISCIMNINDKSVLELLNKFIIANRLNKSEIIHMVKLASISSDIKDLKYNLKWEENKTNN